MHVRTLSPRYSLDTFRASVTALVNQLRSEESRGPMVFIISSGLKAVTQMISALIVAGIVLPEYLGTWHSVSVLAPYLLIFSLGIPMSLAREYAFYRGKGDDVQALRTGWVGITYGVVWATLNLVIVAGLLLYSYATQVDHETLIALAFFALPVFFDPINQCLNDLYRGGEEFMQLGKIQLLETVYLFASIVIVALGGWLGLFIRYASVSCVGIVLRYLWRPIPWRLSWDWTIFRRLARLGLKMLYENYVWGLVFVVDRTLIVTFLGKTEVGYYALALSAQTAIVIIPTALRQVIYARMSFRYGQTAQASSLWRMTYLPVVFNAIILLVPLGVLFVLVGPFIRAFLPQYEPGIRATQLMLVSGYLLCLQTSRSVFPTLNRMFEYNVLVSIMLVMMWALGYVLITEFKTIDSAAAAVVIVMFLHAFSTNILAYFTIKAAIKSEFALRHSPL